MKTVQIELFTFEELAPEVQKKVLEENRYMNTEYFDWYHGVIDMWTGKLQELGFNELDIQFSGFYSQGYGASFTCKSMDINKFLVGKFEALKVLNEDDNIDNLTGSVDRFASHYVHEKTTRVDITDAEGKATAEQNALLGELEEEINAQIYALNKEIYNDLKSEYELATSDETVRECIINQEWTFEKDGTMRTE